MIATIKKLIKLAEKSGGTMVSIVVLEQILAELQKGTKKPAKKK